MEDWMLTQRQDSKTEIYDDTGRERTPLTHPGIRSKPLSSGEARLTLAVKAADIKITFSCLDIKQHCRV